MESYYHYQRDRLNKRVGSFSQFIRNPEWGLPAWVDHVRSWERDRDLLVRYEDLKLDPINELQSLLSLWEHRIPLRVLQQAVKKSSFDNMKRVEEKCGLPYKRDWNHKYIFMRKGKITRGEDFFSEDDEKYLDRVTGELLSRHGYS
jgi:hypothetical protein